MNNCINLRIDFAFKQLFGTKGNESVLIGLLNAILQKTLLSPITSLTLEDPHVRKAYKEDKLSIMDVQATLGTGEFVHVEIQIANKQDIQKRSLYDWSKLYASQMQEGMPYSKLEKSITIHVLDFILFPIHDGFQTTGTLWDIEKEVLVSEDIEIHYIELPKLTAQWRNEQVNLWHDVLARWLLLLASHKDQNLIETLEAIAMEQDEPLQEAIQKWDDMSHNQSFRSEYEARKKSLLDENVAAAHAEKKGMEQGKIQLIRDMYKNGMDIEDIAKFTNMDILKIRGVLE